MTNAQVVETSVAKKSPSQDSSHPNNFQSSMKCYSQVQTIFFPLRLYCQEKFETQERIINNDMFFFLLYLIFFKNAIVTKSKLQLKVLLLLLLLLLILLLL